MDSESESSRNGPHPKRSRFKLNLGEVETVLHDGIPLPKEISEALYEALKRAPEDTWKARGGVASIVGLADSLFVGPQFGNLFENGLCGGGRSGVGPPYAGVNMHGGKGRNSKEQKLGEG